VRKRNKTIIKADRIEHLDVAKVHNPRYLVSRDGEEVGIFPGYNALMAINAARKIYGAGKYSSTKTGEAMYLGRGALETERREREERTARAAAKAAAKRDKIQLPKKSRTRRNAEGKANILQQGVKAGLLPAGLVTDLQRLEEGRFPADPARRANLLQRALKVRNDLVYQNLLEENLLGEAVQRALYEVIAREQRRSRRNPAEKDPEHPIEVTRHYRGGPPGYLSPWQRAMSIGQQELFDTGIKLAPRAAELRARISNPGATKPVYQSGLKQATAGQLPRLARVGLRVGRTPAEIRSDLATTGRFTAEQIRRAIDQATTAERRSNPGRRSRLNPTVDEIYYKQFPRRPAMQKAQYLKILKGHERKAEKIFKLVVKLFSMPIAGAKPDRERLIGANSAAIQTLANLTEYFQREQPSSAEFDNVLDEQIAYYQEQLENKGLKRNPPVREIFETFNGRPATRASSVQAPRRTPARVAQLGRLRLIRTADGRTWRFPGERAPFLAADARGKLHVVGGQYRANPAGEECGEIEQIEYQTSKPHLGHDNETIYYHQLGEETGERPILEITPEGELQIVGGDYRIEADGIHN
jgi:hypothetical protein